MAHSRPPIRFENPYMVFAVLLNCTLRICLEQICRYFLPADIWFLGNPAWCEEQSQLGDEIYTGSGPQEASKSLTSSCYSCIMYLARLRVQDDYAYVRLDIGWQQGVLLTIYIWDQLALQAKESCPSRSLGAIRGYPSLNRVVVGLRVFSASESVVGKYGSRDTQGMASTRYNN
jgi:hypothetical protein